MARLLRSLHNLHHSEICIIKGLSRHRKATQQQIIALFSHRYRTLHHNDVSEIARGLVYGDDVAYPPATQQDCDTFLDAITDGYGEALWQASITMAPTQWLQTEPYSFAYRYHSVGQGLFCSGSFSRVHRAPFRWVYDCGTEHGRKVTARGDRVRREITSLAAEQPGASPPHLDLVTLSHFDTDHLSGLLDLLATFSIGTLLLPYVTPWDRLVIALDEGVAVGDDLLDFLLEPTAFLLERGGGRIGRILLVRPGGEEPALPALVPPDAVPPEGAGREDLGEMMVKTENPPSEDAGDGAGADSGLADPRVLALPRGAALTVGHAWEFVPYNDATWAHLADAAFRAKVSAVAAGLRRGEHEDAREESLDELIALYDDHFNVKGLKSRAVRRNIISLFLYSGPIGKVGLLSMSEEIPRHGLSALPIASRRGWSHDRFGQMFTGDGYLASPAQWAAFETFFRTDDRLYRAGLFQVMHHGSKTNWHKGIAAKLRPEASIFSSDPAGKNGHPHKSVIDDFAHHYPQQVDAVHGWGVMGRYHFF